MKKTNFKSASVLIGFLCFFIAHFFLYQCQSSLKPLEVAEEIENLRTVTFRAINTKTELAQSGYTLTLTAPDGSVTEYKAQGEELVIEFEDQETGEYSYEITKEHFFHEKKEIYITNNCETCSWNIDVISYLAELNETVLIGTEAPTTLSFQMEKANESGEQTTSVTVPAGAVTKPVEICVTQLQTAAEREQLEIDEGHVPLNSFCFLPDGQEFEKPLQISFPVPDVEAVHDENTELLMAYYNEKTEEWEYQPVTIDGGVATAEIEHFSVWKVVAAIKIQESTSGYTSWESLGFSDCGKNITKSFERYTPIPEKLQKYFPGTLQKGFSIEGTCHTAFGLRSELQGRYRNYTTTILGTAYKVRPFGFTVDLGKLTYPVSPETRCVFTECGTHHGGSGS